MSRTTMTMEQAPEVVFNALIHGETFGDWVIGAKHVRRVDAAWPARGAAFYHSLGFGPFTVHDTSEVTRIDPPRAVELEVRIHPVLIARVVFELEPHRDGTKLTMVEHVTGGLAARIGRLNDPLLWLRNYASLRRLRRLASTPRPTSP